MGNCPFLTTIEKEILCFEECIFYKSDDAKDDIKEECPFKNIGKFDDDDRDIKVYYDYFMRKNKKFPDEDYYKKTIENA